MNITKPLRVFTVLFLISMLIIFTYIDISSGKTGGFRFYHFFEPYHAELMVFLLILGIVTGVLIYAFMEAKVERTKDQSHISTSLLIKLLEPNQRKIIIFLSEHDGKVNQVELSRIDGLDKLKVHRALKALHEKGVILIEHYGKTNKIMLQKDIKAGISNPVLGVQSL